MCKINILHDACQTGSRDGKNFPIENHDELMHIFARQFLSDDARAAYCANFQAEMGKRISPVNSVPMRQFVMV